MSDWKRLGDTVISRRIELKMPNRDDLATASGISYRILGDIETGRRSNFDRTTLAKLEQALHWTAGSARTIAEGGEATVATRPAATEHPDTATPHANDAALSQDEEPSLARVRNSDLPDATKAKIIRLLRADQQRAARERDALAENLIRELREDA
ncbi:helix-turn-helix transcriptional regulator [Actinoplanes sp. L3-i22]|uniref:helix-turn-helix domain-containing protein n=1 Tax=Actinoplanes sp. L3-i22 TaxID=2836373 RepID=UPI001C794323|nr:helix-turn-helix transcriptional regulator [Actinoplanes sp. L3-i22]BCY10897.1 hypothetical protein L3i22_059850 [Actinoplanes sp. L3-i22]